MRPTVFSLLLLSVPEYTVSNFSCLVLPCLFQCSSVRAAMSRLYLSHSSTRMSIFPGELRSCMFQFPIFSCDLGMFIVGVVLGLYLVCTPFIKLMASLVADPGLSPFAIILTRVVLGWSSVRFSLLLLSGFVVSSFLILDGSPAHRNNLCLDGMIPLGKGIQIGCFPLDWRWNSHKQGVSPCWIVRVFQDYQPLKAEQDGHIEYRWSMSGKPWNQS